MEKNIQIIKKIFLSLLFIAFFLLIGTQAWAQTPSVIQNIRIPLWLDYDSCKSLRFESREKLKNHKPETLAQASRIPGVNPSDIALLAIIIKRGHH